MPACSFLARRLLPSVVRFQPGFRTGASPWAFRSLSRWLSEHHSYSPPAKGQHPLFGPAFLPLSVHESRRLLALSFIPLVGNRLGLRSPFPAWPILLLRLSALECLTSMGPGRWPWQSR